MRKLLLILALALPLQGCGLFCGICALAQMFRQPPPAGDAAPAPREP